jgi:hypothetical protein
VAVCQLAWGQLVRIFLMSEMVREKNMLGQKVYFSHFGALIRKNLQDTIKSMETLAVRLSLR